MIYVRSGEEVSYKNPYPDEPKIQKTDKCIVSGYRPKAGVRPRDHESGLSTARIWDGTPSGPGCVLQHAFGIPTAKAEIGSHLLLQV